MKQILSAAAILATLTLGACDDVKPRVETSAAPSASSSSMPGMTQPAAATSMPQGDSSAIPSQMPVPVQTAGLNPAHGMPGHTCAIPVGAPLSSAPAAGAAPTITTTPANPSGPSIVPTTPSAPSSAPSTPPAVSMQPVPGSGAAMGSSRLNPAHGQPGHTCDVPVGQPLP